MRRRAALTLLLPLLFLCIACETPNTEGGRLLVTSGFTDQVFVLDAQTGTVLDSLSLDRRPGERDEPHGVAVAPDGRHWYATLSHGEPTLWKFEAPSHRLVGRVTLPTTGASRVRISPDGSLAAVPDYWRSGGGVVGRVAFVRTEDLTVIASPEVCAAPHDAAFSPSGDRVAVTCSQGDGIVILDASSFEILSRHPLVSGTDPAPRPMNAAWTHDGRRILVSLMGRSSVVALDPVTGSRTEHATGMGPAQLALSPGGDRVVVANRGSASLSIVGLGGGASVTLPMPGAHPHGVAHDPTGARAYLTYEGDVATPGGVVAVDVDEGRVIWHTPLGIFTLGVAYLPVTAN